MLDLRCDLACPCPSRIKPLLAASAGLVPDETRVDPEFLFYFMQNVDIYEFSNKSNPPSIRKGAVEDWPITLPESIEEQKRVVAQLVTLEGEVQQLEEVNLRKQQLTSELRRSIHRSALSGEVPAAETAARQRAAE